MASIADIPKTLDDRAKGRGKVQDVGTPLTDGELVDAGGLQAGSVVGSLLSYLAQPSAPLSAQLVGTGVPHVQHHTSGRAHVDCLSRLVDAFRTAPVVPIHSEGTDYFANHFPRVEARADHEWWEL